jgi:hypothetical protein
MVQELLWPLKLAITFRASPNPVSSSLLVVLQSQRQILNQHPPSLAFSNVGALLSALQDQGHCQLPHRHCLIYLVVCGQVKYLDSQVKWFICRYFSQASNSHHVVSEGIQPH